MYTTRNFKTKKELKQAVADWNAWVNRKDAIEPYPVNPKPVTFYQPNNMFGPEPEHGTIFVEGPHYPKPHTWYAECVAKDGIIIKVK